MRAVRKIRANRPAVKPKRPTVSAATEPSVQRPETRWRGASRAIRSLSNWSPTLGSGRSDLPAHERRTLAARSQDAYRSFPLARAAVTRVKTNVVGTGLIAHPDVDAKILELSDDDATELNSLIETRWRMWAENPLECDSEATLDFYGQTAAVDVATMLSGDVFTLTPFDQRAGGIYGLKIQLVDAARVSNPNGQPDSPTLCDGVEFNPDGSPSRYWIRRRHPDDRFIQIDGWDAYQVFGGTTGRRRVLHNWNEKDRVGAVRSAPFLAPILEPLQTLEGYSRSEQLAALVSSFLTILLKKQQSQFGPQGNPLAAIGGQKKTNASDPFSMLELGPAAILDLAAGEDAIVVNPMRPNSKFEPFMMAICTYMGAALELPVDELVLRYQASYSAARAAMLQAWRYYLLRRWHRVQQFCQPLRNLWFDEAVARGIIPAKNYADPIRRAAYTRCIWTGPARGSMDEEKEARAAQIRIETGISNETIETAQMLGEDWSSVYAQRKREIDRRKRDGTWSEAKPTSGGSDPPTDEPENPEEPDNPEEESETEPENPAASGVRRSGRKR